jgi:cyclase
MSQDIFFIVTVIKDQVVMTAKFKDPKPVGKIDKVLKKLYDENVDGVMILDVRASQENRLIDTDLISKIVGEFGFEFAVGGGIASYQDIDSCLSYGASRVVINSASSPGNIQTAVDEFGRGAIIASVDVRRYGNILNSRIRSGTANHPHRVNAKELVKDLAAVGVGNILLTSIDHDGMKSGYDLETLCDIIQETTVPVTINGGASCVDDIPVAFYYGAYAVAARSLFLAGVVDERNSS